MGIETEKALIKRMYEIAEENEINAASLREHAARFIAKAEVLEESASRIRIAIEQAG